MIVISLISFFGGFLTSSLIDTSLGEFSEWAVVGSALIVGFIESFNNFVFSFWNRRKTRLKTVAFYRVLNFINMFKVGLIYGFIVDAFKLGS